MSRHRTWFAQQWLYLVAIIAITLAATQSAAPAVQAAPASTHVLAVHSSVTVMTPAAVRPLMIVMPVHTGQTSHPTVHRHKAVHRHPHHARTRVTFRRYVVRSGDSLSLIAQKFHLKNWRVLWNANRAIKSPNLIYVGQVLKIPSGHVSARPLPKLPLGRSRDPMPIVQPTPAPVSAYTPDGARSYARSILSRFGWYDTSNQFSCLDSLWNRESGWNYRAENPGSGAYGIPQSLPGDKMSSIASDWATNPVTQIVWGLTYIKARYGSPCGAWAHSQATGWY